jgi:hypothetical protein
MSSMCANPHTLPPTGCIDGFAFQIKGLSEPAAGLSAGTAMLDGIFNASSHGCLRLGHANDARPVKGARRARRRSRRRGGGPGSVRSQAKVIEAEL